MDVLRLFALSSVLISQTYAFPPPALRDGHHHQRALPAGWTSYGCWTDNVNGRTLSSASYADASAMTVESCISYCSTGSNAFVYAGVEYADECYCGNSFATGSSNVSTSNCNMPCSGNSAEECGAGNLLNVYWSGAQPPPPPVTVQSVGNWTSLGCYSDSVNSRTLPYGAAVTGSVTVESCTAACQSAGYSLAGAEYSTQCFCGSALGGGSAQAPLTDCDMTCAGNSSEYCGGPNRLNVYNYTAGATSSSGSGGNNNNGTTGGGGGGPSPVKSGLPGTWTYGACYVDNANGRILGNEYDSTTTTVQSCIAYCSSNNFTLAGIEYSTQCFCGDFLMNGAVEASADNDCNMPCGGNANEACGGPNLLSVYTTTGNVTAYPVPSLQNATLPGSWTYHGCLTEPTTGVRLLPYEIDWPTNNTVEACLNQCAAFGYPVAGLEYGEQCFCGDPADVTTSVVADSQCNMACSGDPIHLCGGPSRLTTYYWTGTPMNVWNTPANTGYYEFLIGGLVVPLIATVGINNKVTFLEKFGTSEFGNSTGAYELDISLTDNYQLAWREMHVNSDVFCSGSIILPDKGGRQINVGGWSLSSTYGVRLYYPDGSPGVNGTHDWQENVNELSLQRGRWYPTAMMMPNGSILVVGGEGGSNGVPVPSLEILPKPAGGDTTIYLDYLNRTDPNNLYPFLIVLPSGNFFIGYYNEARILDPVTFDTLTVLPNMPGAVNNFLAGRSYPMEGTAVVMPQHAPYTDPLEILICGGSTPGAGFALDNCISIAPEVENATWTLERMPSKRVMPCIATLPDGTYLILNGAQQGFAGFGLGNDPNLGAVLYDPSQPIGQRMSILNNTIVARLYHSEATLLPDGRVLVSGSDPQTYYPNGSYVYPEEMRIEVYIPPYLNQGFTQPTFTIAETDWALGGQYAIDVTLFQGTTGTMRVSLVAASSSTHGNVMSGGRVIFPEFSCSGTTCTITAPPNAYVCPPGWHQLFVLDGPTPSHSTWVRIGGDPAGLGNWPDYPDFTLPGV